MAESLFNKVATLRLQAHNFIEKETLAQVFSYEYCQIISGGCFLNKFSFELSSVISKVFITDFEHAFVCYKINIAVLQIIEKPYTANKALLKVNKRNLKPRCEIC